MRIPRASEFFIVGFHQAMLTTQEHQFLATNDLGGVILFKRNIESLPQVVALNSAITEANSEHPPIISVDQEGGRVARLRGICTNIPPLLDLEQAFQKDPKRVFRIAAMQARELAALGFQLNFAPVCDVLNHDENEVIGDRAFSADAAIVAQYAAEYIRGLQGAGIAACAKHFPGHGATSVDSHLALPVIDTDMATLRVRELLPFASAIAADVATIMTAHIITKPLDRWPATMSEKTLTGLLRQQLGFSKVIISDDLTMKAVADNYALREILEQSVMAGVDQFIIGNDFALSLEAIALLDELIAKSETIRHKAFLAQARIAALRGRFLGKPAAPDLSSAQAIVRSRPHLELVSSCG